MIAAWIIAETPGAVTTVIGFFTRGGLFMWPLLACSIVSVTTMILRGFALREKNVMPPVIESEIERLVPGGSPERLSRIVHYDPSSLARVSPAVLSWFQTPIAQSELGRPGINPIISALLSHYADDDDCRPAMSRAG